MDDDDDDGTCIVVVVETNFTELTLSASLATPSSSFSIRRFFGLASYNGKKIHESGEVFFSKYLNLNTVMNKFSMQ